MSGFDNIASISVKKFHNNQTVSGPYPEALNSILGAEDMAEAQDEIRQWKDYEPTALYSLKAAADIAGVASISYKDEGTRFGLGSFKALGGAYGLLKLLQSELSRKTGQSVSFEDIRSGQYDSLMSEITAVTATDGNHGRSVAWGAKMFGCKCRIYIHSDVSQGRQRAMEALGAKVTRIAGNYDASVQRAATDAGENGWHVVSDTSYEGYKIIPKYVLAGYSVMMAEVIFQLKGAPKPTHVFLQGGVGGLASAVCTFLWQKYGADRPKIIVVEPDRAPCLIASAVAGKPMKVDVTEETIMAGLSCGEVSILSWEILGQGADGFMTIADSKVPNLMLYLAGGQQGDPKIVAGESAVAGLGGLLAAARNKPVASALGLNADSHILLIGTEGATDPELYQQIIDGVKQG